MLSVDGVYSQLVKILHQMLDIESSKLTSFFFSTPDKRSDSDEI